MRKAGGIVAVVAGVYGMIAAILTMSFRSGDNTVARVGWGGILCSLVAIGLGAVVFGDKSRGAGVLLVITSILGIMWVGGWLLIGASRGMMSGGEYVGISMVFSLLCGVLIASSGTAE